MKDNFSQIRSFMAKNCKESPKVEDLKAEAEALAEAKRKKSRNFLIFM